MLGADFELKSIVVTGGCGFIGSSSFHHVVLERPGVHGTVFDKLTCASHDRHCAIDSTKPHHELGWESMRMDFAAGLASNIERYRDREAWWRPAKEAAEVGCAVRVLS